MLLDSGVEGVGAERGMKRARLATHYARLSTEQLDNNNRSKGSEQDTHAAELGLRLIGEDYTRPCCDGQRRTRSSLCGWGATTFFLLGRFYSEFARTVGSSIYITL